MKQSIYRMMIELTNRPILSKWIESFARSKHSKFFIKSFAKTFSINIEEAEKTLSEYGSLHDFFTRKLKDGVRPIHVEDETVVSPVDGSIEEAGPINDDCIIHAKGKSYTVHEMLSENGVGMSEKEIARFQGGYYMVIYLSPSNYHRIHSPVSGDITKQYHLGKMSYPVNKWGMKYGKDPLSKNFRVVTNIEVKSSNVALVKVGAMFVNTIEVTHIGSELVKGQDFAYFSFGSTVVLLFERDSFKSDLPNLPHSIRMGEVIGRFTK